MHDEVCLLNARNGEEAAGGKKPEAEGGEPAVGGGEKVLAAGLRPQTVAAKAERAPRAERCAQ